MIKEIFIEQENINLGPVCLLENNLLLESNFLGKWIPVK